MSKSLEAPEHLASGKSAEAEDFILQRRYRLVRQFISPDGKVLLDFGCGNGAQTFLFAPHFPLVIGVDISDYYLEIMSREANQRGFADCALPVRYDGGNLPLGSASIDYVISFEVLEHVESEKDVLTELHRVIRPGGILAISVPNRWWIFETHGANLPLLPWNRVPFFSWLPKRIHDRYAKARIYRKGEIISKLERFGFKILKSMYITAPMDVIRWSPLQRALRSTIFHSDKTYLPVLATAILIIAKKDNFIDK